MDSKMEAGFEGGSSMTPPEAAPSAVAPEIKFGDMGMPIPSESTMPSAPIDFGQTEEQIEAQKAAGRAAMAEATPAVVATEAPTSAVTPEVETPEAKIARLEAELAAAQAKLAERPKRDEILKKQREARKAAIEKTLKKTGDILEMIGEKIVAGGEEVSLAMDPDGREYVKEDIRAVKNEAVRRATEAKDKAVTMAGDALDIVGGKTVEVLETAKVGAKDLREYAGARIHEPMLRAEVGAERLFDSVVAGARLKVEDFKIGVEEKVEKAGGFFSRVAGVMEGINRVLEEEEFSSVEMMDEAAGRLGRESRKKAVEAAKKARHYRAVKAGILAEEKFDKISAENEKKAAEDRTKRANKFPNFVSKWRKLFGLG